MIHSLPLAVVLLQSPTSVTLRYQPELKKAYRYSSTTSMKQQMPQGPSMDMTQKSVMVMRAVSRANGLSKVETTVESAKVTVPPKSPMASMAKQMEQNLLKMRTLTTMDLQGKIVSSSIIGGNPTMQAMGQGMGGVQAYAYPKTPVKVGSTWQIPLDLGQMIKKSMPNAAATGKMPITMKVTKIYKQGGRTLVHLAVGLSGNMNMTGQGQSISTKMSGKGDMTVDATTGMTVTQNMRTTSTTSFGKQRMTSTTVMAMKRI